MTQAGSVYGEALYTLALEESITKQLLKELNVLNDAFRENPEENRMLLVKCHGLPKQKQEFMTTIYSIIDNPCEWMNRNLEA